MPGAERPFFFRISPTYQAWCGKNLFLETGVLKRTATAGFHWYSVPHSGDMDFPGVLIDRGCRLGTAIAFHTVEISCSDAEFAENAFEHDTAFHLFGCVISHTPL
jgi:hypothetical protein